MGRLLVSSWRNRKHVKGDLLNLQNLCDLRPASDQEHLGRELVGVDRYRDVRVPVFLSISSGSAVMHWSNAPSEAAVRISVSARPNCS